MRLRIGPMEITLDEPLPMLTVRHEVHVTIEAWPPLLVVTEDKRSARIVWSAPHELPADAGEGH